MFFLKKTKLKFTQAANTINLYQAGKHTYELKQNNVVFLFKLLSNYLGVVCTNEDQRLRVKIKRIDRVLFNCH